MKRAYLVRRSRAAGLARLCGGLAVPVLVLAAIGTRAGLIPAPALIPVLVVGFLLGLAALAIAVYALVDIWRSGAEGTGSAVVGIVYALPALSVLGLVAVAAVIYPRLADVTTDPDDPPEIAGAAPAAFAPQAATLQGAAYPDLTTRLYPLPLGEVYAATRDIIERRGWTIVHDERPTLMPQALPGAAEPPEAESGDLLLELARKSIMTQSRGVSAVGVPGDDLITALGEGNVAILEATAPTPVFGFADTFVVRLRGTPEGTEVDLRSVSVAGAHDLGQNARRIRSFLARLDAALQPGDESPWSWIATFGR